MLVFLELFPICCSLLTSDTFVLFKIGVEGLALPCGFTFRELSNVNEAVDDEALDADDIACLLFNWLCFTIVITGI